MIGRRRHGAEPMLERDTRNLESLALALGSGILLALPFLRPDLFWLHYVALVPWTILLVEPRRRRAWLYFALGAFASFAMAMGPYSALSKLVPFWCALFVFTPWMLVFPIVIRPVYLRWRPPLVVLVPVVWVAAEWLRLRFSIGSVGLFPLAASHYRLTALFQIADLTGAAGVSFVIAALNGALADLWLGGRRSRRGWVSVAAAVLLLGASVGYGFYRLSFIPTLESGPRIALIQPNELHYRDPTTARPLLDRQLELVRAGVRPGEADLVALPENTVDYPFDEDPYFGERLGDLARELRVQVLAGAYRWAGPEKTGLHTSAYHFSRQGDVVGVGDKLYLIPWAESLPFGAALARVAPPAARLYGRLVEVVITHPAVVEPGAELTIFSLGDGEDTWRFAVPICFEITNANFGRRAVDAGADFLLNISSEGFFGAPVYYHLWALSALRAVETRLAVVRVGNNGISGFIDPAGRPQRVVRGLETGRPYLEPGTLVDRPRLQETPGTLYSRLGDWLAYLCVLLSVALVITTRVRRGGE